MDSADVRKLSVPELTTQLTEQMSRLMRQELALAKVELFANARQAVLGGGLLSTGAILGLGAFGALITAAIAGIAEGLPVWASALIVFGVLALAAGALALLGKARVSRGMPPLAQTADTIRKDLHELTALTGRNGRR